MDRVTLSLERSLKITELRNKSPFAFTIKKISCITANDQIKHHINKTFRIN